MSARRLSVGVLVDLLWRPAAGGHVRCWQRLAEAAAAEPQLELTLYFLGYEARVLEPAPNVRIVLRRPLLSTQRLRFLDRIADHTDLAPGHPGLARALRAHDVLHGTDGFAMAQSAARCAKRFGVPLVHSLHTDAASYTRLYAEEVMRRIFGAGRLGRLVCDELQLPEHAARNAERALRRRAARCAYVWGAAPEDAARLGAPPERFGILRRGIDREAFHPARRDRAALEAALGIPPRRCLVLCVGRVDRGKNVMTLAHAVRRGMDAGAPLHLLLVGEGSQQREVRALLGGHATLPGALPQEDLPRLYASADVFAFPSHIEVRPNAVLEAMASGLPVVISARGGARRCLHAPGRDGILLEDDAPEHWAALLGALWRDPARRKAFGEAARASIETHAPSWREVLVQDLLPVWRRLAEARAAEHAPCSRAASGSSPLIPTTRWWAPAPRSDARDTRARRSTSRTSRPAFRVRSVSGAGSAGATLRGWPGGARRRCGPPACWAPRRRTSPRSRRGVSRSTSRRFTPCSSASCAASAPISCGRRRTRAAIRITTPPAASPPRFATRCRSGSSASTATAGAACGGRSSRSLGPTRASCASPPRRRRASASCSRSTPRSAGTSATCAASGRASGRFAPTTTRGRPKRGGSSTSASSGRLGIPGSTAVGPRR